MTIKSRAEELLKEAEKLVRDADDEVAGGYDMEPWRRQQARRRRNAINAACNALHRAVRA